MPPPLYLHCKIIVSLDAKGLQTIGGHMPPPLYLHCISWNWREVVLVPSTKRCSCRPESCLYGQEMCMTISWVAWENSYWIAWSRTPRLMNVPCCKQFSWKGKMGYKFVSFQLKRHQNINQLTVTIGYKCCQVVLPCVHPSRWVWKWQSEGYAWKSSFYGKIIFFLTQLNSKRWIIMMHDSCTHGSRSLGGTTWKKKKERGISISHKGQKC
jgi:hypothetical protein